MQEPSLTQAEAVHRGAELLSESFLWATGLAVVVHQYYREREEDLEDEARKLERRAQKIEALKGVVLESELRLSTKITALEEQVARLTVDLEKHQTKASDGRWF